MATLHSKTLKVAGAITFAGVLVGVLLPTVILPLLPPLPLLTSQLLMRLREVLAFLAFTTAIAIGILSSQRKDAHHDHKQDKLIFEHHPLASIFGELGFEGADPDNGKLSISPFSKRNEVDNGSLQGGSPLKMRYSEVTMGASHTERLLATREENGRVAEHNVQRRLHKKSSSLDDSVNYGPKIEATAAGNEAYAHSPNNEQGNKPTKRVSFFMASSPSSPEHVADNQDIRQSRRDQPAGRQGDLSAASPGDITGQADAFIAKFKEQLRRQRLESFQRRRRDS